MTETVRIALLLSILLVANVYAQQNQPQAGGAAQSTSAQSPWVKEMSTGVRETGEDKSKDARESFNDAIGTVKNESKDPRLPAALNNLGVLDQREGRFKEAEALHQRALKLREDILGKEHPDVAQSLNNLATVYLEQRRYSEAISLYERALEIWKKTRGEDYYKLAAGLNNLASLYEVQGQYPRANRLYNESLGLWEKNRGSDDLLYAQTLENYAGLLRRMGDQPGAADATSKAARIRAETKHAPASVIN